MTCPEWTNRLLSEIKTRVISRHLSALVLFPWELLGALLLRFARCDIRDVSWVFPVSITVFGWGKSSLLFLLPKFQPCPHVAAPFFAEVVSLFPKDLQSLLVEAWSLCWVIAASPCSSALPPYPLLLIPMQVIPILPAALTASPILENPFLGSPVIQHQVEACLPCFKDMSLALSLLCFLARLLPPFKSIQMGL